MLYLYWDLWVGEKQGICSMFPLSGIGNIFTDKFSVVNFQVFKHNSAVPSYFLSNVISRWIKNSVYLIENLISECQKVHKSI